MNIQSLDLNTTAQDGTILKSQVTLPKGASLDNPVAGIVVAPEWWGADDPHPTQVAQKLAEAGFAAVTMDVYGEGKLTTDAAQANEWMTQMLANPDELMDRCQRIYQDFIDLEAVDGERIGGVGYCFGGKLVLDMARLGTPFKAVATFHGNPAAIRPADERFSPKVLVAHGGADSMVPMTVVEALQSELTAVGAWVQVDVYEDAKHGFTNPHADKRAAENGVDLGYHADAAQRSWDKMIALMSETL